MDNLKISNPNVSQKTKLHEKYMNKSNIEEDKENETLLEEILAKNKDLEKKLQAAKVEN